MRARICVRSYTRTWIRMCLCLCIRVVTSVSIYWCANAHRYIPCICMRAQLSLTSAHVLAGMRVCMHSSALAPSRQAVLEPAARGAIHSCACCALECTATGRVLMIGMSIAPSCAQQSINALGNTDSRRYRVCIHRCACIRMCLCMSTCMVITTTRMCMCVCTEACACVCACVWSGANAFVIAST